MAEVEGYVFVKKQLILTWLITTFILLGLFAFSIQYTVYTAQKWCNLVTLFDDTYKVTPPPTATGQKIAQEMAVLRKDYKCK